MKHRLADQPHIQESVCCMLGNGFTVSATARDHGLSSYQVYKIALANGIVDIVEKAPISNNPATIARVRDMALRGCTVSSIAKEIDATIPIITKIIRDNDIRQSNKDIYQQYVEALGRENTAKNGWKSAAYLPANIERIRSLWYDGYTLPQVAEIMGYSLSTVKTIKREVKF